MTEAARGLLSAKLSLRELLGIFSVVVPMMGASLAFYVQTRGELRELTLRIDHIERARGIDRRETREWRKNVTDKLDLLLQRRADAGQKAPTPL